MADKIIQFDQNELELMSDVEIIRTKRKISAKISDLLAQTASQIDSILVANPRLMDTANWQKAKISKGENYKGLAYLVLDHPKCFHNEDILSFRTMFIWGRKFQNVLHIHGKWLEQLPDRATYLESKLRSEEIGFSVSEDPWNYDIEKATIISSKKVTKSLLYDQIRKRKFVKLVRTLNLRDWKELPGFSCDSLKLFSTFFP